VGRPSAAGAVVLVRFPFSDLSRTKLRPAVAIAAVGRGDWILCQVTSNPYGDATAFQLREESWAAGTLRVTSYARPGKLFTANDQIFARDVGMLRGAALAALVEAIVKLLRSPTPEPR